MAERLLARPNDIDVKYAYHLFTAGHGQQRVCTSAERKTKSTLKGTSSRLLITHSQNNTMLI
jgi:hypothetical protein